MHACMRARRLPPLAAACLRRHLSTPDRSTSWPLSFQDVAKFMKQHWEREPAVFKATPERRALFTGQLDYAELLRLAGICEQEGQALEFGVDVNAARYIDGKRETPNGEVRGAGARLRGGFGLQCSAPSMETAIRPYLACIF